MLCYSFIRAHQFTNSEPNAESHTARRPLCLRFHCRWRLLAAVYLRSFVIAKGLWLQGLLVAGGLSHRSPDRWETAPC